MSTTKAEGQGILSRSPCPLRPSPPKPSALGSPAHSPYIFLSLVTGEEVLQTGVPVLPALQHPVAPLGLAHVAVPGLLLFCLGRRPSPHQHLQTLHAEAPAQTTTPHARHLQKPPWVTPASPALSPAMHRSPHPALQDVFLCSILVFLGC